MRNSAGTRETVTVEWNNQPLHVDVIDLPLADVYFNPATHRIRAQRSHDPVRDQALDEDPYSPESQDYLKFLLQADPANPGSRDPEFDKLKESLKDFGQNDPGLITHNAILVNGNTRAAALREIGAQSIRVGVLPESFTWADINAVELALQLVRDYKREYSYINRLLAMEEQAALGLSKETIAKKFRIKTATYDQERWILSAIREQIERSKGEHGATLRLIDYEQHQEKLKELHRAYVKLETTTPDQAEAFKELRMAAIMLGFSKTDVRLIEDNFHEQYLADRLPGDVAGTSSNDEPVTVPGLGVSLPSISSAVADARALNNAVLRVKAVVNDTDAQVPDEEKRHCQEVLSAYEKAFDDAFEKAGRDARVRKRKQLAPARLTDACAHIDQCTVELVQARASRTLDEEAFDEAVLKLRESMRKLAQQASRGIPAPGDGVSWLLEAAAVEGN
ncbi:hypothetical protein GCM10017566_16700 [Amycolatopsis bartoniae]|uniref:Uncharacterized protein n=1 Tax=Amycolatopsis bartoniae TaxID=941986 RepID=A0A8H9M422_9PSEU|nr:hypothetical protein GCM10017566_16700 [Amycolatopsis bartoniae]